VPTALNFSERIRRFFANLSLITKGVFSMAIPVCSLVIAIGVLFELEREMRLAEQHMRHTFEVRSEVHRVGELLAEAENGMRGYLLTKRPSHLEPLYAARKALPAPLAELHNQLQARPDQLERLSRAETRVAESLLLLDEMRIHAQDGRMDQAAALVDRSQASIDALDKELHGHESRGIARPGGMEGACPRM
jgi:CHASE3 domain sensor protein